MNRYELRRYEVGLSRADVAAQSGVPERTIRALESGQVSKPAARTAKALADVYGVTVADLLGVDVQPSKEAA